ncbi:MAG: hypothetical protein K6F88_04600 [Ruminococcus sp.]|nr:hypothetical protein [Ruminococcus sp.]
MKNTRKKMLLSSVAMLLVALVALGSATYAWFTINKTVEANHITVKAAVANGLQITSTNGKAWDRTASFGDATTGVELKPVSLNPGTAISASTKAYVAGDVSRTNGGAWATGNTDIGSFTEQALPSALSTAEAATTTDYVKSNNGYFAAYRIGIKSSDGNAIGKKVTAKVESSGDGADFAKAVLIAGNMAGDVKNGIGDAYSAITATTPAVTSVAAKTGAAVEVLNDISTAQYYTLLVWYEGNDADCVDTAQGDVTNFTVTFELGTASV